VPPGLTSSCEAIEAAPCLRTGSRGMSADPVAGHGSGLGPRTWPWPPCRGTGSGDMALELLGRRIRLAAIARSNAGDELVGRVQLSGISPSPFDDW
jgi:hypothetical protein